MKKYDIICSEFYPANHISGSARVPDEKSLRNIKEGYVMKLFEEPKLRVIFMKEADVIATSDPTSPFPIEEEEPLENED